MQTHRVSSAPQTECHRSGACHRSRTYLLPAPVYTDLSSTSIARMRSHNAARKAHAKRDLQLHTPRRTRASPAPPWHRSSVPVRDHSSNNTCSKTRTRRHHEYPPPSPVLPRDPFAANLGAEARVACQICPTGCPTPHTRRPVGSPGTCHSSRPARLGC